MRSFQQVVLFLFALCAAVFATTEPAYDSTVYVTSTIYRVNTVTASGTPPAGGALNSTTTIAPSYASATGAPTYALPSNATTVKPSASGTGSGIASPTASPFTGTASGVTVNSAFIAVLAAGLGLLAL